MEELMRQVEISSFSGPDLTDRKDICSSNVFASAMSLDMIIVSCIFATMEKACPEDAEADESFQYLVDSIEFELPKVRYSFDVSPPPPPPFNAEVYEELVAMDPHGFQMVRSHLEETFPRLSDVATSSMGANVGSYIADPTVTPAQITKAFLASHGMAKDGLGARVIEARHTGRWRPACKEMFKLFDDRYKASAGKLSNAATKGNPHFTDAAFNSDFDRNLMLYAMLEIKLSLDKDSLANVPYSTLGLYDTICGGGVGGYRVPTAPQVPPTFTGPPNLISGRDTSTAHPTYEFNAGYEIDTFAPIVMYGSLESVRSTHMMQNHECINNFMPEDVAHHLYCNMADRLGGRQSYLRNEAKQRAVYCPMAMHKDRLCNPQVEISIEDTLARPPMFSSSVHDTPYRSRFYIDYWIVPYWHRGEEDIDGRTFALSMRSFVYITSSSDPSVRPGMHRLLDLPVFGDKNCSQLPDVNCAGSDVAYPFKLNSHPQFVDQYEKSVTYTRGRLLMRRVRCSQLITDYFDGQEMCNRTPYVNIPGCFQQHLALLSRPTFYSSRMWLRSLTAPPPAPPPFSPSPPPPNPLPPTPNAPPSPPYVQAQSELMAAVRAYEEQACTSVYYLTSATRCDRLAVALTQSVLYNPTDPPSPPPANPDVISPPPPSPPPSPALPDGIVTTPIKEVRLSTVRIPTVSPSKSMSLNLYEDGYYVTNSTLFAIKASLVDTDHGELVRCTEWQSTAPLPCVSGAMQFNCLSDMRHCRSDYENLDRPFMEIALSGSPGLRRNRLWGFDIGLPHNEELANLFFHSAQPAVGGSGYEIAVYKSDGSPVPCQAQNNQIHASGLTQDRKVQHICAAGGASDVDLYTLMEATRIRITLSGTYRQIWLRSVSVMEISIESAALPPRPPRPPPLPILPPMPPQHPYGACTFFVHQFYEKMTDWSTPEGCGLTRQECCNMAHEHKDFVDAFELDDAGCCLLVNSDQSSLVTNTGRWGFLSIRSGTGLLSAD